MPDFSFSNLNGAVSLGSSTIQYNHDEVAFNDNTNDGLVLNLNANTIVSGQIPTAWEDRSNSENDFSLTNVSYEFFEYIPTLVFNGTNSIGVAQASTSLNITESKRFSIETLLYYVGNSNLGDYGQIITQDTGGGTDPLNWQLRISDIDKKVSFVYQTTPLRASAQTLFSSSPISDNSWNHIAITYNGTNLILYLNGIITAISTVPTINSISHITTIGAFDPSQGYDDKLNAKISYIRVYKDRVLSVDDIYDSVHKVIFPNNDSTIPAGSIDLGVSSAETGYLTGRRPLRGLLFPRGVYNK